MKSPLQLHNLELVIVHLGDHFWLPLLMKQAKFLHKADCSVFHLTSFTLAVLSSDPTQDLADPYIAAS